MRFAFVLAVFHLGAAAQFTRGVCPVGDGDIQVRLGPRLSKGATVSVPSSPGWDDLVAWSSSPLVQPDFVAAVGVRTEGDVQEVIKYANQKGTPFLAASGRHGWTADIGRIQGGIMIDLRGLNSTSLNRDGKTAVVGGGILQHELVAALYEKGKYAVTGLCECTSVAGPLLGKGHSILQGNYGFAADNLVSARVVLADGRAVTVSERENKDLFWGLRGAGHNFGVVVSMEVKVYDASKRWTLVEMAFEQEKLESYFETWKRLEDEFEDVGGLALNGAFVRNDEIDTEHPIITLQLLIEGSHPTAAHYQAAFFALDPVANRTVTNIEYKNVYDAAGLNTEGVFCKKNINTIAGPNSYSKWPIAGMRAGFELFSEITANKAFAQSIWGLESHGRRGPLAVSPDENAVAPEERSRHLLYLVALLWTGNDEGDRAKAFDYIKRMREAARPAGGTERPHTYVNYAIGDLQNLAIDLLLALQSLPASRLLRSSGRGKNLLGDLLRLNSALNSDDYFDLDRIKPLLKSAIANDNDALIWKEVYNAVTESTPPPRPIASSFQQTPWLHNTGSFANSSEYRKDVDRVLRNELGVIYVGLPRFYQTFFGRVADLGTASEAVFEKCKEDHFLSWFSGLSEKLATFAEDYRSIPTHQRRPLAQPNKPIQGSTAERKLDIGFVDDPKAGKDSKCHWSHILIPGELKSNPAADSLGKAWLDIGTYAREVLAAQDTRRFVLGFTICGSFMRIWEFDRLGGLASERFDINEDGLRFVSTVLGFLWMNEEELGFDPAFITANGQRFIEIERNGSKERLIIDEVMQRARCIAGRATTCWKAHREGQPQIPLVIKDSWQYRNAMRKASYYTR
ncbi:hypothetical protein OQA88_12079 [Cercophora sp. LCS_1]